MRTALSLDFRRGIREINQMRLFAATVIFGVVFSLLGCLNPLFPRTTSELPQIEAAEPSDALFSAGMLVNSTTVSQEWHYSAINVQEAWGVLHDSLYAPRFNNVVVAVIDTGVSDHSDLNANLDLDNAWDFFNNVSSVSDDGILRPYNPTPIRTWHGTHVAGTVGAVTDNDGTGVSGIGWNRLTVLPLKVFEGNDATIEAIVNSVLYAAGENVPGPGRLSEPVKVINLSLGGASAEPILREAIEIAVARGITVIAAAGNCADAAGGPCSTKNQPLYPAAFPNVIAVGATTKDRERADYSNYGSHLEFVAPGGGGTSVEDLIWSTNGPGEYYYFGMAGTSMAAPHVAGVVGLMYAYNPNLTQYAVRDILRRTAVHPGGLTWDPEYGFGLIDAGKALLNTPAAIGALHRTGETPLAAAGTVGGPEYEPPEPGAYLPDDATEVTPGRVMVRLQLPDTATGSERDEAVALLAAAYGAHDANRFHPLFVTMEFDPARDVRDIVSRIVAEPTVRYSQGETRYTLLPIASTPWIPQSP